MKTIEQKAKAYDEIIERAKTMLSAGEVMYGKENNASQLITDLIPDLKESEDERINKAIFKALSKKEARDVLLVEGVQVSDALAYIEKQKDLFESGRGLYYYDGEKTTYCGYPATEENPYDFAMSQQEKQKPAEKQNYSGLTDFERAIHRGFLCAGVENVPVTIIKETAQDCLAHIKPVELKYWDKEMVRSIISILERDNCFKVVDEKPMRIFAHEQEINYLRNLQEYLYHNPHWKPSEEQMEELYNTFYTHSVNAKSRDALESLYNQLKKL